MTRDLCRTLPADWWDVGDDGNRLALMLCSVCPSLQGCGERDPEPHGVILAGRAWGDDGLPLGLCDCGRPIIGRRTRKMCFTCMPYEKTTVPTRLRVRRQRGSVDEYFDLISQWRAERVTFEEIARRLRMRKDTVRKAWRARCAGAVAVDA